MNISIDNKVQKHSFLNISFPLGLEAEEINGIEVVLPIGSDPALLEQVQNHPLANELGKLLCLAMGNPAGCVPLRVRIGE